MHPPKPGKVTTVAPGLRCVLAPNPSPMTHWGTNTFILGEGDVAIIDPGPDIDTHLQALIAATSGEKITHILITHAHGDHSPLSRKLSTATNAPILGFGAPEAGRSGTMAALAEAGLAGGGEGVDAAFMPDQTISEGDRVAGESWSVDVLHTPGHFAGHLAFDIGSGVISGDHVMDWSSSLVSPPDGDIAAFMRTSRRLLDHDAGCLYPSHGAPISQPAERLEWLINHRLARETAILNALTTIPQKIDTITRSVYSDIPPKMLPAAARNVFAHLIDLVDRNLAAATPILSTEAKYSAV